MEANWRKTRPTAVILDSGGVLEQLLSYSSKEIFFAVE